MPCQLVLYSNIPGVLDDYDKRKENREKNQEKSGKNDEQGKMSDADTENYIKKATAQFEESMRSMLAAGMNNKLMRF